MNFITVIVVNCCLLTLITRSSAQSVWRPRGLYIQVSTADKSLLARYLDNVCTRNQLLPVEQKINDIVLTDIAIDKPNTVNGVTTQYTMLFDTLDAIVPFLPHGSQCFGNVFIGTLEPKWNGSGSLYIDAVKDPAFRQRYIDLSKQVANEFVRKYPSVNWINWYITFESNLNYLIDANVKNGYQTLLSDLIKALKSVTPPVAVFWSPTFWSTWSAVTDSERTLLQTNLNSLFTNVRNNAAPGVNWIDLQDGLGKATNPECSGVYTTRTDVVNWYRFVRNLYSFTSVQVNEELFRYTADCQIVESAASTQISNENYYGTQAVNLGAAFEIRYWRERQ